MRLPAWCFPVYQNHGGEEPATVSLPGDKAAGQPVSDDSMAYWLLLLLDSLRILGMTLTIR